jgi:trehalose 6-phosphate synthase/phosphatase
VPDPQRQGSDISAVLERIPNATGLTLLLDYDGTLVPLAATPQLAAPDDELLGLLGMCVARAETTVHIVSGRPRDTLDRWFGRLPIALWAEHGFFRRDAPDGVWTAAAAVPADWATSILPVVEQVTATTPGSFIERKTVSLAWHYRLAPSDLGARQADQLRHLLKTALSNTPFEVLPGKKVVEVRLRGMGKGQVAQKVLAEGTDPRTIVAIGDDYTDEDLFRALPRESVTIAVGRGASSASYRVADPADVRELLRLMPAR